MSALEAIANFFWVKWEQYCGRSWESLDKNIQQGWLNWTASLLAMKQDCAECGGNKVIVPLMIKCKFCHGTGKSDLNIIYEACQDQTLSETPNFIVDKEDLTVDLLSSVYRSAQQAMLTPSIENGEETVWMKVKTGRKVNK